MLDDEEIKNEEDNFETVEADNSEVMSETDSELDSNFKTDSEAEHETQEEVVSERTGKSYNVKNIDRVLDIDLELIVKIGELKMRLKDVLDLHPGSIIEVDRNADAPLDLLVGKKILAKGEVVTIGENLGLRITQKI